MDRLTEKVLIMDGIFNNGDSAEVFVPPNAKAPSGVFAPSPLEQATVVDQSMGRSKPTYRQC